MEGISGKLIVKVDFQQKREGDGLYLGKNFNANGREKWPVVAEVLQNKGNLKKGDFILCHHNLFYGDTCPFLIQDDLYSIPLSGDHIFAVIDKNDQPKGLFGNIIVERIPKEYPIYISPAYQKNYNDRVKVLATYKHYKPGDELYTWPLSDYEIVYVWKGREKRVIKVKEQDIVGVLTG